jgi:hypothetical protein
MQYVLIDQCPLLCVCGTEKHILDSHNPEINFFVYLL